MLQPGARFCPACGTTVQRGAAPRTSISSAAPSGALRLVVRWSGGQTEEHQISKSVVQVGRAPSNDIVLNFPTVSSHHLKLEIASNAIYITDLNSTNGTQVRGSLITPGTPQALHLGDTIRVGDLHGNSISMSLKGSADLSTRTRSLGMHALEHLPQIFLGRDPSCQVHLDHPVVSWRHAELSRQGNGYAIRDLGSANGTFVNGQRVTGWGMLAINSVIQIGPYRLVYDGQVKALTSTISQGHRLDAIDLGVQVKSGFMILSDVTMAVHAGEFVALVGGSGAGKSTLLKAMNGYSHATHGRVMIDGQDLYANMDAYRTIMAYVPQDDIIHRDLPVRSALRYAARLRLPDANRAEVDRRVDDALKMVDMAAHADKMVRVLSGGQRKRVSIAVELLSQPDVLFLDEPTSGLDPGLEKKMMYDLNRLADQGRTVMLVTHATGNIEQCDYVAFLVRGRLAYYGPPGEAISFFQAQDFADIYLKLSEQVNLAAGKSPAPELQQYYAAAQSNAGGNAREVPAGLLWAEHYRHSPLHQRYITERSLQSNGGRLPPGAGASPQKRSRDSMFRQMFILAQRQFELIRRDVRTLFVLLIMMPVIGLLFMLVSKPNDLLGRRPTTVAAIDADLTAQLDGAEVDATKDYIPAPDAINLLVMISLALTQAGTFGASYEIVKERAIFKRERAVNLSVGAYVFAKMLVLGSFAIIQVASVIVILSLKVNLDVEPVLDFMPSGIIELFITLLIGVVASIMLGLFISSVVPSPDMVMYIILVQLFAQIILSGTLFPLPDNPASKLAISHWAMDAMGSTVDVRGLNDQSRVCTVVEIPDRTTGELKNEVACADAKMSDAKLVLSYEHSRDHLLSTWAGLGAHALVWALLTIIVQLRKKAE